MCKSFLSSYSIYLVKISSSLFVLICDFSTTLPAFLWLYFLWIIQHGHHYLLTFLSWIYLPSSTVFLICETTLFQLATVTFTLLLVMLKRQTMNNKIIYWLYELLIRLMDNSFMKFKRYFTMIYVARYKNSYEERT